MAKKPFTIALYFICALIAAYALSDLKSIFTSPTLTLEQSKYYAKELSGDENHPPIILFYTSWCPACKATQKFLNEKKIPFIAAEIEQNLAAQYFFNELTGGSSPIPVIVVGDTVIVGYKPWTILDAVQELQSS